MHGYAIGNEEKMNSDKRLEWEKKVLTKKQKEKNNKNVTFIKKKKKNWLSSIDQVRK